MGWSDEFSLCFQKGRHFRHKSEAPRAIDRTADTPARSSTSLNKEVDMATFAYNYILTITESGGDYTVLLDGVPGGTAPFSAADVPLGGNFNQFFENGEIISFGDAVDPPSTGTYVGTVTLNGEQFILLDTGSGFTAFGNVADPTTFEIPPTDPVGTPDFTTSDIQNTAFVDPDTVCFAAGTLISTPGGSTSVETLAIGDLILTADGRTVPVKWIGRQTVQKFFAGERARPVRVAAGALGDSLPHTDLVLTADHALILDGLAINAGALVNGTTITLEPLSAVADRVTYYHVETEKHDVILANGAPAETYVDYVGRQAFDNHAEYVALYGEARTIAEMPLPRVSIARLVPPALEARLAGVVAA
jgi:hypothetical protein